MTASDLRLVFAGTPGFAAFFLDGLIQAGHSPVTVYSQPDRPAGRGKRLTASPVKQLAVKAGLPVSQPVSLKAEAAQAELAALRPDLLIVVAYGLILPQAVLDIPRLACLNVHASLLPRWRGAAPIQRAIEAGDSETGITIMQMEAGLDTGPVLATRRVAIAPRMNAGELHNVLADAGLPLLLDVLENPDGALANARPQDDALATYAPKIEKAEARLDWQRSAAELDRQIRAFNPFPVCWTELDDCRIKIWEAEPAAGSGAPGALLSAEDTGLRVACGDGVLRLTRLQLAGGKPLPVAELLRSRRQLFAEGVGFR
jgi:methionyl-tRNA formyltransferase